MIGNSLIIQVATAGVAIGIVMTYIQPTITTIRTQQDDIAKVREESERISEVNRRLASLYAQVNEISQRDKAALYTYLPDTVDDVRVLKDLNTMAEEAGVLVSELSYGGLEQVAATAVEGSTDVRPEGHLFNLTIQGSYEQFKQVLLRMERNNYPLVVQELSVSPTEGGLLTAKFTLVTYAHQMPEANEPTQ